MSLESARNAVSPGEGFLWLFAGSELALLIFALLGVFTLLLFTTAAGVRVPGRRLLAGNTIRGGLLVGLAVMAVLPALALTAVLAERSALHREERFAALLTESASSVAGQLDQFLDKHVAGISTLAAGISSAADFELQSVNEWLALHHGIYTDYLTMLVADARGQIVTATRRHNGRPEVLGDLTMQSVSDRDYFRIPLQTGDSYVSDVFRGRGLGTDTIVAVSAPLLRPDGGNWGIVEGSLDLAVFDRLRARSPLFDQGAELLILDAHDRLIFASPLSGASVLERYPDLDTLNRARADLGTSHPTAGHIPVARSSDGEHVVAYATTHNGWQVLARLPVHFIHGEVFADVRVTLFWLAAAIFIAVGLATAIARRVTQPLHRLGVTVRELDLAGNEIPEVPEHAPEEVRQIFGHLRMVRQRLDHTYRQLNAAVAAGQQFRDQLSRTLSRREEEIERRTRELEQTNAKLEQLSRADPLTGLANRRCFMEALDRTWRLGRRDLLPVSLVIIDIDYFKAYNDTYGHQAGDTCLRGVAVTLASSIGRPLDLVARIGGEEFVMILNDTPLDNALRVAERTRAAVEGMAVAHSGSRCSDVVTISLGVASTVPDADQDGEALIKSADESLYFAKQSGRNRVATKRGGEHTIFDSRTATDAAAEITCVAAFPEDAA